MSNELAARQGTGLAISEGQTWWTTQQEAALGQLGIADAPKADQAVFLHQCQRTGLDPFARQIYMIGRWSKDGTKYTIQTSIDGFRLIGHRAAQQRGETLEVSDTEWCGQDGAWRDVWLSKEPPAAARVAILRNGGRFPAVALFTEYVQTKRDGSLTQMWQEKGALMIAKCAEALAWRKAYPQDLSGIYTADEMSRANAEQRQSPPANVRTLAEVIPEPHEPEPDGITDAQTRKMGALMREAGLTDRADALAYVGKTIGREVASRSDLTKAEASLVIDRLAAAPAEPEVYEAELIPEEDPA